MSSGEFEDRRRDSCIELDQLIESVEKRRPVAGVELLPRRFREACADLALARHRMYGGHLVGRLNDLVIRGYKLLYRSRVGLKNTYQILEHNGLLLPEIRDCLDFVSISQAGRHGRGREKRRTAA